MYTNKIFCSACGAEINEKPPTCSCGSNSFKMVAVEDGKQEEIAEIKTGELAEEKDNDNPKPKKKKQKWM